MAGGETMGSSEGIAPQVEGASPRGLGRFARILTGLAAIGVVLASGCSSNQDERTIGVYTLAITDKTAPAVPAVGDEPPLYQVTTQVRFPLRPRPDRALLGDVVKPYTQPIWFTSGQLQAQFTYVIKNLGNTDVTVELLVDGWNEFIRYSPTVAIVVVNGEQELQADRSVVDRLMIIPAYSTVEGRISYDDFERMATALAILTPEPHHPNPFHVVEPHTKLATDPTTMTWIPPVIDGITGFDLSLRARGAVKIVLEGSLELVDHTENGEHLVPEGEPVVGRSPPPRYVPVVALPPP